MTRWEIKEHIGILTLDNPPGNYILEPEFVPLEQIKEWTTSAEIKGIMITGGGKHFSSGGDLSQLYEKIQKEVDLSDQMDRGKAVLDFLENLNIPVLAAIKGICFGGGLEIALASHIRVCSDSSLFALPESNYNLIPGLGGTVRLPERIGLPESLKLILGGDMISAEEALALKLVDYVVPGTDLLDFAFRFLLKITRERPLKVIQSVMQILKNSRLLPREEAMKEETRLFCELALEEARRKN